MAIDKDFIVKNGLVVLAQGSADSTSTTTGAIVTPGGIGIGGSANIAGSLTVNGVNLLANDPQIFYVADHDFAKDTNSGAVPQSPFRTLKHALSVAGVGDTILMAPGTYEEIFPLTIPTGVSVRGAGLRECYVHPTVATQANDAFLLNGECTISDFTVGGFYKPGYAFKLAPGAKVTTRSPYIERFSVITKGSTTTASDPYGFAAADAGNGILIDGSVVASDSQYATVLFNESTFIVPNAIGVELTNGARAEYLNGFTYFASKSIYAHTGNVGFAGAGKVKLRLGGISGTIYPGDTLTYRSNTGTVYATGTVATVAGDYVYISGPQWGFRTDIDVGTSTQQIFVSAGTGSGTATNILLADYHQFGGEMRSIASAAVFGTQGAIADGTGTDLKLIAFNMSHIGAGGDLSDDISLVNQAAEVIQTNNGKVYFQTIDQSGDFRVGNTFFVNQRTGDVSFGTATINLASLPSLLVTDGINNTVIQPTSISVGNLLFSTNNIQSSSGNLNISAAGPAVIINDDTTVQGAFTATGLTKFTNNTNATSTTTGAVQIAGGLSVTKDTYFAGNVVIAGSGSSATVANLIVTNSAYIPGAFTATSLTATTLNITADAIINRLTATTLTVTGDALFQTNVRINGITTGSTATFLTINVSSTANSISTTSGALTVAGGVGIKKDLFVGGNAYLYGDLYVDGDSFIVSSTNLLIADKTITLASTATSAVAATDAGVIVGTGTGYVSFLFDGSTAWKSKGSIVPNGTQNLGGLSNPWNVIYGNAVYDNSNRVVTSVSPSAGLGIGILNTSSNGPAVSFQVTNTGVLSLTAGTDTVVNVATGNVTIWDISTLQSVTGRGGATNRAIQITNTTPTTSRTTGSLVLSGGLAVAGAIYAGTIVSNSATVWTTATLTDNIQLGNGAGYLTSSTIGLYGVSYITGGTGISVSASTGAVTVTNIGVVSLQGTSYLGISASSGSSISLTNLGVQTLTAGTDTSVSRSTGTVTVWSNATLQSVTSRGNTTNQTIAITATNLSASTSSGQALLVSGGVGALAVYAQNLFDSGNRALTSVTPVGGTSITISNVSTSGPNTTFTVNNAGVTATIGTTYLGVSTATGYVTFTNLGVQTLTAGTDTSVSQTTGTVIVWNNATLQSITNRGLTTTNVINITNETQTNSTNSGALRVAGGVGINKDLYVGGSLTVVGTLNAGVVVGSITTASNIYGGTPGSIPYQFASGVTSFIGTGTQGSLLQMGANTATFVNTSSIHVKNAQWAVTATNVDGGFVWATTGYFQNDVQLVGTTAATSTNTGVLRVTGGVGVWGAVYSDGGLYDRYQRVVTTVVPTAGTAIGISNLVSTGTTASFAITNLGVQAAAGTTYLGVSSSTGTVTFTNLGVQTVAGTTYLGVSSSTGTVTLTNLGVQTLTAGTDTAVSSNTGTITVWTTATLQSVTARGATTPSVISFTNATNANTATSGALQVTGGVGVGLNLMVGGNLQVWGGTTFGGPVVFNGTATWVYSTNTYMTDNIVELHNVSTATNQNWAFDDGKDIGHAYRYYNRSLATGTTAFLGLSNDNQWLEWISSGFETTTSIFTGTYGNFKLGAIQLTTTTNATNTLTGALVVTGGAGIGNDLYVGNKIYAAGSQVITAATLGSFGVAQILAGPYISVSPASGTGTVTIGNLGVQYISVGSGLQASTSTGTVILANIDTLQLVTGRGNSTTNAISILNAGAALSTTTAALTVAGGVGIAGNLIVNGTSTFNGLITGSITTANNISGGTQGAIHYQSAAGVTSFINAVAAGSVLASNGINTVPQYVTTSSLLVGTSQWSNTSTNIAAGVAGQVPYQTGAGATAFTGGSGSAGNVFVSNGSAAPGFQNTLTLAGNTQATSTNTGALIVQGGAGIWKNLYVGGDGWFNGSPVVTANNLSNYGVALIKSGTGIAIDTGTGTVTITNIGVTSLTTTTNGGIAVSTSTGSVTIQSIDTLQLVTQRGNTTNQQIYITATNLSSSTGTGQALMVSGGIGALAVYATNLFDNAKRVITAVQPSGGTGISITGVNTANATVSYTINNTGVTSAIGTAYLGVSAATGAVTFTNLGVQSITAGTGTTVSASTGQITINSVDNLQMITNRGATTTNVVYFANTTQATSTLTGAIQVTGGIGVQGDIWARNIYTNGQIVGGASSTSSNLSGGAAGSIPYQTAPGATSFIGIGAAGSVLVSNGTTASWTGSAALLSGVAVTATNVAGGVAGWIPIQKANSQTSFISSGTSGQLLMMGVNTASWASTSSITVQQSIFAVTATNIAGGAAGQVHYQSGPGATSFTAQGTAGTVFVSNGTAAPGWQNTLTLAGSTQATSTATGALTVAGGVGVGGNLWVGGTLYATVQGSINTATNIAGGSAGALVYQVGSGITNFISIGSNGSLLQSNGSTASWVTTATLVVGFANASAATSALSGGSLGSIPYQIGANATSFIGIGAAGNLLISNGSTATWTSTNGLSVGSAILATTATHIAGGAAGGLPYQTAAGRTGFVNIGAIGSFLQSNGTTPQWVSTGSALVGTAQNINGGSAGQIPYQESGGVTRFIGTSTQGAILQMGAAGTATFVSSSTITVGSAINAFTATLAGDLAGGGVGGGALVYQAGNADTRFLGTGTAGMVLVSRPGAPAFENSLTLASTVQATSTNTGALIVAGGVGIAGNLYIGGTLYATVAGATSTASNLAAGVAGAIAYQSAPGVTAFLNPSAAAGPLIQSNGTGNAPSYVSTQSLYVGRSTNAIYADDLTGGAAGSIPIQRSANVTDYIPIGPAGYLLQSQGTTATWITTGSLVAGIALTATNIAAGAQYQIPYQTAVGITGFSSNLTFNGTALWVGGAASAANFIPTTNTAPSTIGMFGSTTTNVMGLATNGVARITIGATPGYVGISNVTPTATLDVGGGFKVSGVTTVTNTLDATGAANGTGAVQIAGGVGIAKSLWVGAQLDVLDTTNATSTTTGALYVAGGAGINGNIWAKTIYANSIDVVANAVIMATAMS